MKQSTKDKIKELILLKFKFGLSSLVATSVNYGLYILLEPIMKYRAVANFIAYFSGVIVNFILQKKLTITPLK